MTKIHRIILYSLLLITGILILGTIITLNSPKGTIGLILTIISIYLIIASTIKLCVLSEKIKSNILYFLNIIFWLP